jgi:D-sedoheptulose 7-phosphate isomerase
MQDDDKPWSIAGYLDSVKLAIDLVSEVEVAQAIELLWQNYMGGRRVAFCGNGGSASTASHLPADLQKNILLHGDRPWECLSLCDSVPLMTAWSNDTSYDNAFAGQARVWMRPGDLLVAISGSGNSANILTAVETAKQNGATTIGICGFDGGRLATVADHSILVPVHNMQIVEDVHMVIGHTLYLGLKDRLEHSKGERTL